MNENRAWIAYLSAIGDHYHRHVRRDPFFRRVAIYFTDNSCTGMNRNAQTLSELREWTGGRVLEAVQFALSVEGRDLIVE